MLAPCSDSAKARDTEVTVILCAKGCKGLPGMVPVECPVQEGGHLSEVAACQCTLRVPGSACPPAAMVGVLRLDMHSLLSRHLQGKRTALPFWLGFPYVRKLPPFCAHGLQQELHWRKRGGTAQHVRPGLMQIRDFPRAIHHPRLCILPKCLDY